jgi:multiple sugar transport system permease protein
MIVPKPAALVVNGVLASASIVVLFPLLWMLAASFMAPGEASTYPPPLVPAHPTLANYRELFAHAGMGRYLANSVLLAVAATALSLVFNVMAGDAFAKLRFRGREQLFRLMLGALVIPGQVAMVPLFLLLKHMGLVNTYGGVIVPALASLSREHVQDNELMMAGAVLTTLPVLIVFLSLQRYYMQGLMMGAVKG